MKSPSRSDSLFHFTAEVKRQEYLGNIGKQCLGCLYTIETAFQSFLKEFLWLENTSIEKNRMKLHVKLEPGSGPGFVSYSTVSCTFPPSYHSLPWCQAGRVRGNLNMGIWSPGAATNFCLPPGEYPALLI